MTTFYYYINLDERGEFFADVRDENETTIFEIHGFDLVEDGFVDNLHNPSDIETHLIYLGVINSEDEVLKGE
jgi:hypothetical protein